MLKTSFWKEGGPTSIGDPVTTARVGVGIIKTTVCSSFTLSDWIQLFCQVKDLLFWVNSRLIKLETSWTLSLY